MGYKLSCIRSTRRIDLGPARCLEADLKGDYGAIRKRLHEIACHLIKEGRMGTYELHLIAKGVAKARIYFSDDADEKYIWDKISNIAQSQPRHAEGRPDHTGMENFLDAVVSVALDRAGFRNTRRGYIKGNIEVRKRTILDCEERLILFLDYVKLSLSIANSILRKLNINEFRKLREDEGLRKRALELAREYVGKAVFTWIRGSGTWGRVVNIRDCFVGDEKINGRSLSEIWRKKETITGIKVDEDEYPVFIVNIGGKEYLYPPSVLRPPARVADPPEQRLKIIEDLMKNIKRKIESLLAKMGYEDIKFEPVEVKDVSLKPTFYYSKDIDKIDKKDVVKLTYKEKDGRDISSPQSPLFAFSKGLRPYAGEISLNLVLIYPDYLNVKSFRESLIEKFNELNLGSIKDVKEITYSYSSENLTKSRNELREAIAKFCEQYPKTDSFMVVVIPEDEDFYRLAKTEASLRGYHTQLIKISNLEKIKGRNDPKLANICGGIYVEFLLQRRTSEGKPAGPLTWKLSHPADGSGKSMYIGLDVSRKRGIAGAAFILFDPYGELVDARIVELMSETITGKEYQDIFDEVVKIAKERSIKRIVILRDGPPRTEDELKDCLETFGEIAGDLGYKPSLEYISVIKSAPVRIFEVDSSIQNPIQGTYCYLHKLRHFNLQAHEVLVVSTKPKESNKCTKPVLLRIYEVERELNEEDARKIAEEYLSLTRLNFWNLETGTSRLALPIKMADTLSYMRASGIPVRHGI